MILPKFLWDNVIRGITPTWSGTTVSGSPPASAIDWRDFSFFQADSGNLDFVMTADKDIDTVSMYSATFTGTGANTIQLQYESSPAVFTPLQTITAGGKLTFDEFSGVTVLTGRKIRFVVTVGTGSLLIRQLVVGEAMEAEQGQWATATNPEFFQGIQTTNTIAQNGSVLGRSLKRVEKSGRIMLENLTAAWVRSTWEPFAQHMARYPFVYSWNPRDYPDEVAWVTTPKITAPNHTQNGLLSVNVPCHFLVADEDAI